MSKVVRAGVSFPAELLESFDKIVERMGLGSRSRGIQEAIRTFISINSWNLPGDEEVAGVLLIHYSHEEKGVEEELTHTQHEFLEVIPSTLHVHLSEKDCLLIITVKGKVSRIRDLVKKLRRIGRLKQLTHVLLPVY